MKKRQLLAAIALAATAVTAAHAEGGPVTGFVGLGVTGGGDTLATVTYTNGDTQDIKSGGLVEIKGGFEYRQAESPFAI